MYNVCKYSTRNEGIIKFLESLEIATANTNGIH